MKLRARGGITLVAATLTHIRTELEAPENLAALLDATVSSEWPPGEYDRDAMDFFRTRLEEGGKAAEGWYNWYGLLDQGARAPPILVGAAGYFGPPAGNMVEIGYSILPAWRCRGYASGMVQALVENAFSMASVDKVIAHTTGENPASAAVLLRCGFRTAGPGHEPNTVRFEHARATG